MGNSFGRLFRVTTFGESHGPAVGAVIDGCPPGLDLTPEHVQAELNRRRPGRKLTSPRQEKDLVEILSGTFEGHTTGTPLALVVFNRDADSSRYEAIKDLFRPGHADYTYQAKYGLRDWRGGGRSSARETIGRVAAGAVARQLLETEGIGVLGFTLEIAGVKAERSFLENPAAAADDPLFCPDPEASALMAKRLAEIKRQGDSAGGIVEVRASGVPAGLGEPVFDKLDADLAKGLMSIGAVKGVEIGAGFAAARSRGSTNNDQLSPEGLFRTNNAGGILGGISSGQEIIARVAVKPIPSISLEQDTVDTTGQPRKLSVHGRHDICAIPRIVPVCEAMVRLVLADHLLRQRAVLAGR
ncbi:MAG: chorismate synthase [Pseudomonadota bacterium]